MRRVEEDEREMGNIFLIVLVVVCGLGIPNTEVMSLCAS